VNYKGIEEFYNSYIEIEKIKRTGWIIKNVPTEGIESVSDHTLQVVMLAITLNYELSLKFDISKLAQMCFLHDIGEAVVGDVAEIDIDYIKKKELEKEAVKKLLSSLSEDIEKRYYDLWTEMEEISTPLAKFAYQVDKIDIILKSKYYAKKYGMPELFHYFYDYQKEKKMFTTGPLKDMFENIKLDEE
jgi:5'-deoxynucleotidase YfbR-like HD superfamily hydrolase